MSAIATTGPLFPAVRATAASIRSTSDGSSAAQDWWHLADGDWGAGFFQNPACDWCDDVQMLHDHVAVTGWRGALVAGPAMLRSRVKRTIKQTPMLWAMVVKMRALVAAIRGRNKPAPAAQPEGAQE